MSYRPKTTLKRLTTLAVTLMTTFAFHANAEALVETFGATISDADSIPLRIGELNADPERYVDRQIKVVGLVDDVCPMKGCWVDIIEAQSEQTIRLKVQDDVIVFPATARGKEIVAEGILRKITLNKRQTKARLRHEAKERGEAFDNSKDYPAATIYQLEGKGAQIAAE